MDLLVVIGALALLMFIAYRGYSVVLFAPVVALGAVFFFEPIAVFPSYMALFMEKTSFFVKMYFPMFLLGAIFGKVIELSGFSKSIVAAVFKLVGVKHATLAIIIVTAILSYGGVSAFVLVFAVYPFAAELFRMGNIPKRLIPGIIWVGGVTFAMDALPGSPQIQNIIPTTFFKTTAYAAPVLGIIGSIFIFATAYCYMEWLRKKAMASNEGYDSGQPLFNEPADFHSEKLPSVWISLIPLIVVGAFNYYFTTNLINIFGAEYTLALPGMKAPILVNVAANKSLWAVQMALFMGIMSVFILSFKQVGPRFAEGSKAAVSGCLLAIMNTASEYGYGSIIAVLPGFLYLADALKGIPNPLISEIISVCSLAGIVGSASGGLSIALASMSDIYISAANAAGIPLEVAHRVASMASGGMDSLPHNGAVITALAVTGLTHRQAYGPIFVVTLIKTAAVFVVVGVYYLTGWV